MVQVKNKVTEINNNENKGKVISSKKSIHYQQHLLNQYKVIIFNFNKLDFL
jgi:hypothetical protein